jgi:hypothetical protein
MSTVRQKETPAMKLSRALLPLMVASMVIVAACGGDDDAANVFDDSSVSGSSDAEGSGGEGSDGLPALFELSACDTIPAEELDAAGFEPEPSNTLGEAGDSTGNGCWWEGGLGSSRTAMVGFVLSDLESNYFEEVITDEGTEVDGRPARRITGFDDLAGFDAHPACGVRIEVESGVILEVEVSVSQTENYSTDDEPRLSRACAILDALVPTVSAHTTGGETASPGEDEGAGNYDGDGGGAEGATIPSDAEITSELLCGALVNTEIPAPGFEIAQPAPQDSTADAYCTWESLGGDQPQVDFWYTSSDVLSPDDARLETDGRDGSIVPSDTPDQCRAQFRRAPGTVVIEVVRVDDACGVAEELARLLAPRLVQAG